LAVEFIAPLAAPDGTGLAADPDYPARIAGRHEEAGVDRLLIDDSASSPDGISVASQVLTATARLGVLVTCRPALVSPAIAAAQYATLAAFHPGRVALHLAAGDAGQARCAQEFLDVIGLSWSSAGPFSYAGDCYRVNGAWSAVRPGGGRLPVYLTGDSGAALRVAGRHADVCIVAAGPRAGLPARLAAARAAAARHGRALRLGVRMRPDGRPPTTGAVAELASLGVSALLLGGGSEADLAGLSAAATHQGRWPASRPTGAACPPPGRPG
jgi:alkanesulfonate monooxygenase